MSTFNDPILNLFADDSNIITYRPKWAKVIGSITGAIFLQQAFFHWHKRGGESFYKFNAPCKHRLYREGDSWQETLGFTKREFLSARDKVSVKKTADMRMDDAIRLAREQKKPVVYWTDAGRVTHYTIVPDVFRQILEEAYGNDETKITNRDLAKSQIVTLQNHKSGNRNTKTTTKTTTKNVEDNGSLRQPTLPGTPPPRVRSKQADTTLQHEAVRMYQKSVELTPNKQLRALIVETVTDLDLWQRVLTYWQSRGWDPKNVAGMLDRYLQWEQDAREKQAKSESDVKTKVTEDGKVLEFIKGIGWVEKI